MSWTPVDYQALSDIRDELRQLNALILDAVKLLKRQIEAGEAWKGNQEELHG